MKRIENGELVELSAAGKKLTQNHEVKGYFGMVVDHHASSNHPYQIEWYRKDGEIYKFPCSRYEIKRFRGSK